MIRREQLPEEATEEPRILSPEEQGARALERQLYDEQTHGMEEALRLSDADSPLRMPGEMSSRHRDRRPTEQDDDDVEP
jgi:hypothetical protein